MSVDGYLCNLEPWLKSLSYRADKRVVGWGRGFVFLTKNEKKTSNTNREVETESGFCEMDIKFFNISNFLSIQYD